MRGRGSAQEKRPGEHQDLGQVAAQQEDEILFDVVEDGPAFLHRGHQGGEVVVRQDHGRGLLGDFGAGDAHGHADIRPLQGRGVVDPVPGHGHHLALRLEDIHQAELMFRGHPGEHPDLPEGLFELRITQLVELRTGDDRMGFLSRGESGPPPGRRRRR